MPILFAITLFASAALLFSVQPMIARMILPKLGGSPAVWNTCMVFFQVALLVGYLYAHLTTRWLGIRRQALLHLVLLACPFLVLPLAIPESTTSDWPAEADPVPRLLRLLILTAGLPFLLVSTSAPLLQAWFAHLRHRSAQDPYFLYAASNAGSLLALLSYPIVLEPGLGLTRQSGFWAVGYAVLAGLVILCALAVWRSAASPAERPAPDSAAAPLLLSRRLRWLALSFVPSSLLLGVTTYLATDIASMPLLWVVPLMLYLLTFILVFARRQFLPLETMNRLLPIGALVLLILILSESSAGGLAWVSVVLHLGIFFVAAMVCHGELARDRPEPVHLTEFYLWMSLGGALGGIFNALAAPLLFRNIFEYPLALVLACLLRPSPRSEDRLAGSRWLDGVVPATIGLAALVLVIGLPALGVKAGPVQTLIAFGLPAAISYLLADRPIGFGLACGSILLASVFHTGAHGTVLHVERNFFGVLRVTLDPDGNHHRLVHGSTIHGQQSLDPARRCEPLAYYHPTGPIGHVFEVFNERMPRGRVAVVGLGVGSLACYAQPAQEWTFYEIDPAVERIARHPAYFRFLSDCVPQGQAQPRVILGDARLRLREAETAHYDLFVLDAFSSDAIPTHLVTREALALYIGRLKPDGLLAFHISNRYLDLHPVLANLAAERGLVCRAWDDLDLSPEERQRGKQASQWVVMASMERSLGRLQQDPRWRLLEGQPNQAVWTDDYCNLIGAIRWW